MPTKLQAFMRQRIARWNRDAPWLLSMVVTSAVSSAALLVARGAGATWG